MSYYSYTFNSGEKRTVFKCPWDLSEPAECDNDDTIVAVGVDDNGNQIQLNINSDVLPARVTPIIITMITALP